MKPNPKAGSFTPYLEYTNRSQKEPESKPAGGGSGPLFILYLLADAAGQQLPLPDLMAQSRMDFQTFSVTLNSFREAGFVVLSGDPGKELAQLTPKGVDAVRLARMA